MLTGYHTRAFIYFIVLVGCLIGALSGPARLLFAFLFLAVAVSQFFFLCPRCGKHIDTLPDMDGGRFYFPGEVHDRNCPRCGRTRETVWMGQYFLNREPWDGVRDRPQDE